MSNFRPKILQKIEKALNEMSYRDAIENSSKYNNQLVCDRKTRLPFIDAQTGVAQKDSYLWMKKWQRMPGTNYGKLYTYPSNTWKKKRRCYLLNQPYMCRDRANEFSDKRGSEPCANGSDASQSRPEQSENSSDKFVDSSKDAWAYADYEDSLDFIEGEFEVPNSDADDYDEFTVKRRRRRKETSRRRRGQSDLQDNDKPYACDHCDARYKTRPGLTYHYAHSHQNSNDGDKPSKSSTPVSIIDEEENSRSNPGTNNNNSNQGSSANDTQEQSTSSGKGKNSASPSPYCDFCLGDSEENKKSRSREKMVSCSDCGRSAHPTCLQFTPQMILSVQKYRWQCIECKSCGLCGTSDNDEQLLFCDDCDRGYHMFCLNPPLSEPPEGSWSCHLCIEEYHKPQTKNESSEEANKNMEKEEKEEKTDTNDSEGKKKEKDVKCKEKDKADGEEKIKNDVEKQKDGSKSVKASNNVNEPIKVGSKDELIKLISEEPRKIQPENEESKDKDDNKEIADSIKKGEKLNESPANPPKKA